RLGRIAGRRQALVQAHAALPAVIQDEIGEGAADVETDAPTLVPALHRTARCFIDGVAWLILCAPAAASRPAPSANRGSLVIAAISAAPAFSVSMMDCRSAGE